MAFTLTQTLATYTNSTQHTCSFENRPACIKGEKMWGMAGWIEEAESSPALAQKLWVQRMRSPKNARKERQWESESEQLFAVSSSVCLSRPQQTPLHYPHAPMQRPPLIPHPCAHNLALRHVFSSLAFVLPRCPQKRLLLRLGVAWCMTLGSRQEHGRRPGAFPSGWGPWGVSPQGLPANTFWLLHSTWEPR